MCGVPEKAGERVKTAIRYSLSIESEETSCCYNMDRNESRATIDCAKFSYGRRSCVRRTLDASTFWR